MEMDELLKGLLACAGSGTGIGFCVAAIVRLVNYAMNFVRSLFNKI